MKTYIKGSIVYIYGLYKGEVVEDTGKFILVKPLEGVLRHEALAFPYLRNLVHNERVHKMENAV